MKKNLSIEVKNIPEVLDPETGQVEKLSGRRVAKIGKKGVEKLILLPVPEDEVSEEPAPDSLDALVESGELTYSA